ncbi:MAG: response regulator [Anaerolineales bacterium]|nr:response regulator [Anaerolineales bacterium]
MLERALQPNGTNDRDKKRSSVFDRGLAERHPLRILLADDNSVNQKVALRILNRLGYDADVAANGVEVIEALGRRPYDVVLMDVQMPEMDGLEATRTIRSTLDPADQPVVIAMTASALAQDRLACTEAGMDGYISKPIQLEQLTSALELVRRGDGETGRQRDKETKRLGDRETRRQGDGGTGSE